MFGAENKESCQKNICRSDGSDNIVFWEKHEFRKYRMPRFLGKYL